MSAATTPSTPPALPLRPRLVLRAGFAGRQELAPDEETRLQSALRDVLITLGHRLAAIAPGVPVDTPHEPSVSAFYERTCPLLRLITGLCEGADAVAARTIGTVHIAPDPGTACAPGTRCLETELAAVLPFDVESYRGSRPAAFQAEFDGQLAQCAWVLALDGIYDKPDHATLAALPATERHARAALATNRRGRAYRAQSAFLLRHSDLLIAAANPDDAGRAGGTLETVREALAFELPVVFIHTGTGAVHLVEPQDDLPSVLTRPTPSAQEWQETLRRWVTQLTVDPDSDLDSADPGHPSRKAHGETLLEEFFDHADSPWKDARKWMVRFRKWAWMRFERCFRAGPGVKSDTPLPPYAVYRGRATDLNYHYSGLYRGAFLLNYALAIAAICLAASSLALLATARHAGPGEQASGWLLPTLLLFAVAKLAILFFISGNTRRANGEKWNDRAVDYRYLAERMRGMFYLPLAQSHQPPGVAPPQFASRVVRQSAVDWLFDAIVRAVSPADMPHAQPTDIAAHDGRGVVRVNKLLTCQPVVVMEALRDRWIGEQTHYHERNATTMHALHEWAENSAEYLSRSVIAIVAVDFVVLGGEWLHLLPPTWEPWARLATPWLVFTSAVLPAIVAALSGIRFQSECQRLAERSAIMRVMLHGRSNAQPGDGQGRWQMADILVGRIASAQAAKTSDPGSWSHDALRLIELVATDFVQEAAEWSVLYAREVSDPG